MESELYRSVVEQGVVQNKRDTIIKILMRRMGWLDMAIREKIRAVSDVDFLNLWYDDALGVVDAEGARRLAEGIQKASIEQINR